MKTLKNIMITVGSGIISFMYIIVWTMIFAITGILMMVDFIHNIWTKRRIPWITAITDVWADMFAHPFTKKA